MQKSTDLFVLKAIDKGLSAIGNKPKETLLFSLEKDFGLDWPEIPQNITAFEEILKKFFGPGYTFLNSLFLKFLEEESGLSLQNYESFAECVNCMSEKLQRSSSNLVQV